MERFEKQLTTVIICTRYNHFRISCPVVHELNMSFLMQSTFHSRSLYSVEKNMRPAFEKPGTVNFDIPPPSFTVILIITFVFQHFLTSALRRNPYIIELIPLEFLVQL